MTGPEGHHAATVRRVRPGEAVDVTDGLGRALECAVLAVRRDEVDCAVRRRVDAGPPQPRLVVVQALAKGDRGERAVEMLTEVGVDEIIPWSAARSVVRWEGERGERSRERWARTAAEAAKQSHRLHWPVIGVLVGAGELARRASAAALTVVLHEQADAPLVGLVRARQPGLAPPPQPAVTAGAAAGSQGAGSESGPEEIVLVVGPEGGLADDEVAALRGAGAVVARLGPTVLRTSTAGVVAAAVVLAELGRWDGPPC